MINKSRPFDSSDAKLSLMALLKYNERLNNSLLTGNFLYQLKVSVIAALHPPISSSAY